MDESTQANSCWQRLKSTVLTKADESHNTMGESNLKACVTWILKVTLSPIAWSVLLLMALYKGLLFMGKAALLFVIAAINTPFAIAFNVSVLVFDFMFERWHHSQWRRRRSDLRASEGAELQQNSNWSRSDPRANVGVELRLIVSDFFKVIADKLLVVLSTAVITFYTSPLPVFYTSMVVGVAAILLTWLNTSSISKTAFSCLCDAGGLSPLTFFFSFIGLFDIGCHPVAKCSFLAKQAFLFTNDEPVHPFIVPRTDLAEIITSNEPLPIRELVANLDNTSIEFERWNAFERGLFQLSARIDFVNRSVAPEPEENQMSPLFGRSNSKYILKSFMVLKVFNRTFKLCAYPVERLELPEDYTKVQALLNFLKILAKEDGFVTDKVRGRYEHSLSLLEITEGVEQYNGYKIVDPVDDHFVVAGCSI